MTYDSRAASALAAMSIEDNNMIHIVSTVQEAQHFTGRLTADEWALHVPADYRPVVAYMHRDDYWVISLIVRHNEAHAGYLGPHTKRAQECVAGQL